MTDTSYQRNGSILFGDIGDDIVALSLERSLCYGMENVTAAVWSLLEQPLSADELCARLLEQYDVPPDRCRSDIAVLLAELEKEGLVEARRTL
jgi:hypothetical protein